MNVSKKALSLLISFSMVVTSFAGTAAFAAAQPLQVGASFVSGSQDSGTFNYVVTSSGPDAVELNSVTQTTQNSHYWIPNSVVSGSVPYQVTAINQGAFVSKKATMIIAQRGMRPVTVQSRTFDANGIDISAATIGGYVGLYKDSTGAGSNSYQLYEEEAPNFHFDGWYGLDNSRISGTQLSVDGTQGTTVYARFTQQDTLPSLPVAPGDTSGSTLYTDETQQLKLEQNDDAHTPITGNFTWSVELASDTSTASGTGVVHITSAGAITGVKEGRVLLKAQDGNNVYYVRLVVEKPSSGPLPLHIVRTSNTNDMVVGQAQTWQVKAGNQFYTDFAVALADHNGTVSAVKNNDGSITVTALKAGKDTVRVTDNAKTHGGDSKEMTVADKEISGFNFSGEINFVGDTEQLGITTNDGKDDQAGTVTWTSSNPDVVQVNSSTGEAKALKIGTAKITAAVDGYGTSSTMQSVGDKAYAQISYSTDGNDYNTLYTFTEYVNASEQGYGDFVGNQPDNLYVKLPCQTSKYSFSAKLKETVDEPQLFANGYNYFNFTQGEDVAVSTSSDGDSTVLKFSGLDKNYPHLIITAKASDGSTLSFDLQLGYNAGAIPDASHYKNAGTYVFSAANGKMFAVKNDGTFWWGKDLKRQVKYQSVKDQYNFTYDEYADFTFDNETGGLSSIKVTISADDPTACWVKCSNEWENYDFEWNTDKAAFEDYDHLDSDSNYEVYTLNGTSVTPGGDDHNDHPSTPTTTNPSEPIPGTSTTTQSATGAATVTYTTAPSVPVMNGTTSSFSVSVPADAAAAAAAAGTAANPATLAVKLPDSTIVSQLTSSAVQSVALTVSVPSSVAYGTASNVGVSIPLDPSVLQAAQAAKKDLTVIVLDSTTGRVAYSWTFTGSALASATGLKTINLAASTLTSTLDAGVSRMIPAAVHGTVVAFANNGILPARAKVNVYVGDQGFTPGEHAYLYYANEGTGVLETTENSTGIVIDAQGYAQISITHNSKYVLLPKQVAAVNPVKLDTGKKLSVKAGQSYLFKVTSSKKPGFASGNSAVFMVAAAGSKGNDYFFKVTAVGKVGSSTGFYLNDEKTPRTVAAIVK